MLDAFGIPQPTLAQRILLGARYAPLNISASAAITKLIMEVTLPGKFWQAGLPVPFRDNRVGATLQQPDALGSPYAIEIRAAGQTTSDGVDAQVAISARIGTDANVLLIANAALADVGNPFVSIGTIVPSSSWKTVTGIGGQIKSTGATGSRTVTTLTVGLDVSQTLSVVATYSGSGGGATTLVDWLEVWITSLIGWPVSDSVVG